MIGEVHLNARTDCVKTTHSRPLSFMVASHDNNRISLVLTPSSSLSPGIYLVRALHFTPPKMIDRDKLKNSTLINIPVYSLQVYHEMFRRKKNTRVVFQRYWVAPQSKSPVGDNQFGQKWTNNGENGPNTYRCTPLYREMFIHSKHSVFQRHWVVPQSRSPVGENQNGSKWAKMDQYPLYAPIEARVG